MLTCLMELRCYLPCKTTAISAGTIGKTKDHGFNYSIVDLTFSDYVMVSSTAFPAFNFIDFLSNIGGSMGLWLGLGVAQLFEKLASFILGKYVTMECWEFKEPVNG